MSRDINDTGIRYKAIRRAQFISPFGVGSIVDFPDESVMPAGIELWGDNIGTRIYDDRLQRRLGVRYFKMPPSYEENKEGIPYFRFPKWLFCPRCRGLKPIETWKKNYDRLKNPGYAWRVPRCDVCRVKLVPTRFIMVCEKGHIDDFPWEEWVHKGEVCGNPDLEITTGGSTSGLGGISIKCKNCNKKRNMQGAFDANIHKHKCTGFKPWSNSYEKCEEITRTAQRGASNIYFPKVVSSIVIPPYADDLLEKIRKHTAYQLLEQQKGIIDDEDNPQIDMLCQMIAKDVNGNTNSIKEIICKLLKAEDEYEVETENSYRYEEYQAFLGKIKEEDKKSKDFHIEIREGNEYEIDGLDNVVQVHRLREVRSLVAFSRLRPLERNYVHSDDEEEEKQATAVSLRDGRDIEWLPAVEVRGEGIFISFNSEKLNEWTKTNSEIKNRVGKINKRFNDFAMQLKYEERNVTPKFIFLHTLAHLLIRELSFECGYSSASLREKIYCDETQEEPDMAGILIYTASGDSEGTMGGLVRQADPSFFKNIIKKAVINATWCSNDPLCIESDGQGFNSLNLGACHACTLLPETSCEELNRFLDRAMIVGLPKDPSIGFLSSLL
ncbi:MAG: DUF1998 domain-containing protein [Clostridiaceae bacterium]|nr:DUF1998 domain-containing protein [Clostridiaceae bacterium]